MTSPSQDRPPPPLGRGAWLAAAAVMAATAGVLAVMGRSWWCACGEVFLATADAYGRHTSQHLLDPYSLTHLLHGIGFWWIVRGCCRRLPDRWTALMAIVLEALWEILENTPYVIERYRAETAALGYLGDSVGNAVGDIACAWLGVVAARRIGFAASLAVFVVTEVSLALWIRDNLTLNILMLLWPNELIRQWQLGG